MSLKEISFIVLQLDITSVLFWEGGEGAFLIINNKFERNILFYLGVAIN